jgi:site-specific recombinase XerD
MELLFHLVLKFPIKENNMIDDIFAKFDGAFAENTIRAYRSDFIQYQTWCVENRLEPIPATADTMAMYVDYLSENNKSATIRRRINSLGHDTKTFQKLRPHQTTRSDTGT